ncbi:Surface antigen [Candidatus Electrothrix laxa]
MNQHLSNLPNRIKFHLFLLPTVQKILFYKPYRQSRKKRYTTVFFPIFLIVFFIGLFLASCAPVQTGKKKTTQNKKKNKAISTQAVGHNLEASLRGDAAEGPLFLLIKKEMDRYDREQVNHVFERGLSGRTSSWTNPDKGNQYRITPLPALQTIGKSVCRKAKMEAMLSSNDQLEPINTKACRANNGRWRISEEK